jgi:(3,5-dihydroxyphenyl)acetyl-CoA 1,2-dioxygenase
MSITSGDTQHDVTEIYATLTNGFKRSLRVAELVYEAAERFPGLLPTRAEMDAERNHRQKDKVGLEIAQGDFIARVLADRRCGTHLIRSMSQPRAESLAVLDEFLRRASLDLGPIRLDQQGPLGLVTFQNHTCLNAEDDDSVRALEIAVDLVLLDDSIDVGVLRGGQATHPKYAGRRIFGSGINLNQLYDGKISFAEFMIESQLGPVSKMYRGQGVGSLDGGRSGTRREKPWIAAVEGFAIGGACQLLLVMDRVIAEAGSYFSLPARNEGIIPGCANLRLPRLVGERLARQAIFFDYLFAAETREGRLIADEVVSPGEIDAAIERSAAQLTSAGTASLVGNRRALHAAQEPLGQFRRYMSTYSAEQARCLYSPALIDNLERNWKARATS